MTSIIELLSASPGMFIATCLAIGLAVGSFLNVVIYRLPVMLERQWREQCADISAQPVALAHAAPPPRFNLVVPRSACPACRAPISAWHNVPIISWLMLRGRCASCGKPIGVRYPLVEALTGVLTAVAARKDGMMHQS